MATSLARRAATLARISPSATRAAASLIPRRGLAGAARHAPPKVPIWNWRVPLMNSKLAISLFLLPGMAIHVVILEYALPSRGKDEKEKIAKPAKW